MCVSMCVCESMRVSCVRILCPWECVCVWGGMCASESSGGSHTESVAGFVLVTLEIEAEFTIEEKETCRSVSGLRSAGAGVLFSLEKIWVCRGVECF